MVGTGNQDAKVPPFLSEGDLFFSQAFREGHRRASEANPPASLSRTQRLVRCDLRNIHGIYVTSRLLSKQEQHGGQEKAARR